jgi:hypothetical protein
MKLYEAAILETDWTRMEERIHAAEAAIKGKLHEFTLNHGGAPEENQAHRRCHERNESPEARGRSLAAKTRGLG